MDDIDVDNLFLELNDAATEDNDSPLTAIRHIKNLQAEIEEERSNREEIAGHAINVMRLLHEHGGSIVPHLLNTDDNSGQFLRQAIEDAGYNINWDDPSRQ